MDHKMKFYILIPALAALLTTIKAEQEYFYAREEIPLPKDVVLEASGIALLPENKVAVSSRRGEIWICEGAYAKDLSKVRWTRYTNSLHEPLGIFYKDGSIYATTRQQIVKMTDLDGDDVADRFETLHDSWGFNGDYHEYNFGSSPDAEGNIWVTHCLTGSKNAGSDWRGWAFRYNIDGEKVLPTCAGIRSPGGIGFTPSGDCFYTDNQGLWNGSSSIKWLNPGSFQGNPSGNKFAAISNLPAPPTPNDNSTTQIEYERDNRIQRPAVVLPHGLVGQSPTGIIHDHSKGGFGPFSQQLLIGEQTHSEVQRVYLEKVKGQYQGAVWSFLSGFKSGIVPIKMGPKGTLFTGGTNRGWASKGGKPFTFERVKWNGNTPFEMHEVKVTNNGFIISFTKKLKKPYSISVQDFQMKAWTYQYRSRYGSKGLVDEYKPQVTKVIYHPKNNTVQIVVDKLTKGHIHQISLGKNIQSTDEETLWHPDVYYTLNELRD